MYGKNQCVVCGSKADEQNVSLFRFPRNAGRCKQWVVRAGVVGLKDMTASIIYKKYRLCSLHFDPTQFRQPHFGHDHRRKLIRNAVPTFFNGAGDGKMLCWPGNIANTESSSYDSELNDNAYGNADWPESAEEMRVLASHLCRLCASVSDDLVEVFEEGGQKMDLCNKIHTHLPIKVTEDDALPTSCCNSCISKLEMCHNFVVTCLDANDRLCAILHLPGSVDNENADNLSLPEEYAGADDKAVVEQENYSTFGIDEIRCIRPKTSKHSAFLDENNMGKVQTREITVVGREGNHVGGNKRRNLTKKASISEVLTSQKDERADASCGIVQLSLGSSVPPAKKKLIKKRRMQKKKSKKSNFEVALLKLKKAHRSSSRTLSSVGENLFRKSAFRQNGNLRKSQFKTNGIRCNLCSLQFMNLDRLQTHRAVVHSHLHFKCQMCGKLFGQESNLRRHIGIHKKSYTCKICFETLSTYKLMILHRRSHIKTTEQFSDATNNQEQKTVPCIPENENSCCNDPNSIADCEQRQIPVKTEQSVGVKMPITFVAPVGIEAMENGDNSQSRTEVKSEPTVYRLSNVGLAVTTEPEAQFADPSHISSTTDSCEQSFDHLQKTEPPLLNLMIPLPPDSVDRREHIFQEPETVEAVNSIKQENLQYEHQICQVEYEQAYIEPTTVHEIVTFVDSEASNNSTELYHCSLCNKIFTTELAYRNHLSTHSVEKKFVCATCQRPFAHQWALDSHLRIHSDEKPFACSFCGEKFLFKRSLVVHERIHNESKSYKCNVCEKCFNSVTRLRQHVVTHSDDWPFRCSFCAKEFRRREALKNHMAKHTDECKLCNHKPDLKIKKENHEVPKRTPGIKSRESTPSSETCVIFGEFGSSDIVIESQADSTPPVSDGNIACEYVI